MAQSIGVREYTILPDGKVQIVYTDGAGYRFENLDAVNEYINSAEDLENAKKLIIGWWTARDSDRSNFNIVNGKVLTLDLSSPNPVKVQ